MAKRMLIDATHPEETRVVVLNGNRLEEFDYETSTKKQVKGNIYLAKVTRVEPSLQAAFVEYGGNRHGFLAFSEIHADYYRIPVADRRGAGAGYQPAELVRSETAGEAADENGVPLEEALPEPVRVLENDPTHDDPENEAFFAPTHATPEDRETGDPAPHAEASREIPAETSWTEDASWDVPVVSASLPAPVQSAPVAETGALSDEDGEKPGLPSASHAVGDDPTATPVRTWIAASAGDDIIAAPQELSLGSDADQPTAIVASDDQSLPSHDRNEPEDIATPGSIEAEHQTHEFTEPREPAEVEPRFDERRFDEIIEASARNNGEHRDHDSENLLLPADPEYRDDDGFQWAVSSDEGHSESASFAAHRPAEDAESDRAEARNGANGESAESEVIETLGGDEFEEVETQRSRVHRHYKIQEVIKRRQIMLVQVTKEERGNKGAALTTYLSLAGRYCVLMPNTARGGGVSRKITSLSDRRRLKEILEELEIPEGMGVIVRTAGGERSKAEIKRDYEYLLRLWNEIRELTLRSTAPALIYEEGDLIKRSIRDLYTRDIDEVLVEGEEGYKTAKAFMKMLMPSHAKRVQPYRDPQIGLLHRFQVESQIDAIHSPVVQLRSGGYVVIDQTEALVAIDVNSGRATRERNIEETALRTNLEAAEEIARQLRLRDLAGLIVIDFIDMEEHRNQAAVERRLKEALRNDRARIQVGRISPFGLLEMSRQRLRSSLAEASTQPCPHCGGTGFIRSTESTALYVLRSIEEEGMRHRVAEVCVYVPTTVALYILNHKRDSLAQLETRYGIHVLVARDDTLIPPAFRLERLRAIEPGETAAIAPLPLTQTLDIDEDEVEDDLDEASENADAEANGRDGEDEHGRARRRRRRRRRHEEERVRPAAAAGGEDAEEPIAAAGNGTAMPEAEDEPDGDDDSEAARLRRRRGRRGGRRRSRRDEGVGGEIGHAAADSVEIVPVEAERAGDAAELDERDAPIAAANPLWSRSAGQEPPPTSTQSEIEVASLSGLAGEAAAAVAPAVSLAATEIETASLPVLAGEGVVAEPTPAVSSVATESETVGLPVLAGEAVVAEPTPAVSSVATESETVGLPVLAGEGVVAEPTPAVSSVATESETVGLPALVGEDTIAEAPPTAPPAAAEIETAILPVVDRDGPASEVPPTAATEIETVSPPTFGDGGIAERADMTAPAATGIETASLPPVAGEPALNGEDIVAGLLPTTPVPAQLLVATEIETTSLAALAGDGAAKPAPQAEAAAAAERSPPTADAAADNVPPTWRQAVMRSSDEAHAVKPAGESQEPHTDRSNGHDAALGYTAPLADSTGETPASSEIPPTASEPEPTQIVQEVTRKPENPRRGWWQRLIQS